MDHTKSCGTRDGQDCDCLGEETGTLEIDVHEDIETTDHFGA